MKGFLSKYKRSLSIVLSLLILGGAIPVSNVTVQAAEASAIAPYTAYVSNVPTPQNSAVVNPNYDRSYDNYVVNGPTGLVHPGILHHEGYGLARERALGVCIRYIQKVVFVVPKIRGFTRFRDLTS